MSFQTEYADAQNAQWQQRVEVAVVAAAIAIAAEAGGTANHLNRVRLAQLVLQNPASWAAQFALGCTSQGLSVASSLDSDISGSVSSIWNAYAGVG